MKCEICGKEIKSLGQHIRLAHKDITGQEYYDKYIQATSKYCLECGKPNVFRGVTKGYYNFCCQACAMKNKTIREKISQNTKQAMIIVRQNNLEKYGVEWYQQTDEFKQKYKDTSLQKYGTIHPMQNEEIRNKRNNSNLQRFGYEYPMQSPEIKKQVSKTNLEKYGVTCPLQQTAIRQIALKNAWSLFAREKRINTIQERYGVTSILQTDNVRQLTYSKEANRKRANSIRETLVKNYNVRYACEIPYVQELAHSNISNDKRRVTLKNTLLEKYGISSCYQLPEVQQKAIINSHTKEANEKRANTFKQNGFISGDELLFMKLAEENNLDYIWQYYSASYPYNCDFYIPSKQVYIEINSFWTHNTHWFNKDNEDDLQILEKLKAKQTKYYNNAIYVWTNLDVRKRAIAKENNLNYVVLWNKNDIEQWFVLNCPIRKDWVN